MSNESTSNTADRKYLYKYKNQKLSQHDRRIKFLEELKAKRHHQADENRKMYDLLMEEIEDDVEDENMEFEYGEKQKRKKNFKLMPTEWFSDIPDDLEENWLAKLTPEGLRVLLVTRKHSTCFYNKKGYFLFKTKTNFPGGGENNKTGKTVLDCIYNRASKTFFILDCLFWTVPVLNSEATFRFYWLESKFQDMPELSCSLNSKYKFVLMDSLPSDRSVLQDKLFATFKVEDHEILYDGVVFYHKESQYTFDYTPLATWLFSYMLPEKLGINIPEIYHSRTPSNYQNLQHYIENRSEFFSSKKTASHKKSDEVFMDI